MFCPIVCWIPFIYCRQCLESQLAGRVGGHVLEDGAGGLTSEFSVVPELLEHRNGGANSEKEPVTGNLAGPKGNLLFQT